MSDQESAAASPAPADGEHEDVAERHLRILEALLFASNEPLSAKEVHVHPGPGARPALERASLDKKAKPRTRNPGANAVHSATDAMSRAPAFGYHSKESFATA